MKVLNVSFGRSPSADNWQVVYLFYSWIQRRLIMLTNRHRPLSRATWVPSYWKSFWICSSSFLFRWPRSFYLSSFPTKILYPFDVPSASVTPISQLIFLDLTAVTAFYEYKFMKLFISLLHVSTHRKHLQAQFVNVWIIHNLKMPIKTCMKMRFCSWST